MPIRFTGDNPVQPELRFEAELDSSTLLLNSLTIWSEGTKGYLDIDYEIVETISVDSIPAGLFEPPPFNHIVKQYTFLSLIEAKSLGFDVHYVGDAHGEHELRHIFHYNAPENAAFYTNPTRGVWVTYQPPDSLDGEASLLVHSQPISTDSRGDHPEIGASSSGGRATISNVADGTRVTVHAPSIADAERMVSSLRVIDGGG